MTNLATLAAVTVVIACGPAWLSRQPEKELQPVKAYKKLTLSEDRLLNRIVSTYARTISKSDKPTQNLLLIRIFQSIWTIIILFFLLSLVERHPSTQSCHPFGRATIY